MEKKEREWIPENDAPEFSKGLQVKCELCLAYMHKEAQKLARPMTRIKNYWSVEINTDNSLLLAPS